MIKFSSLSVLFIEDDPSVFTLIHEMIKAIPLEVRMTHVTMLKEAVNTLQATKFDLIITDLFLPDSRGVETIAELQKHSTTPVLMVDGIKDEEIINQAIRMGAQDYIPKDELNPPLLLRIIVHALERYHLQESLRSLSFTDELTGIYNRRGFFTLLEQQIDLAKRTKNGFYLFLVDLDYLKKINDTYGHLVGDQALKDAAECLKVGFRRHDILGRIGGDEFAIIILNAEANEVTILKKQINEKVAAFNQKQQHPYTLSLSIGTTFYDGLREITSDELFRRADEELYEEKKIVHRQI